MSGLAKLYNLYKLRKNVRLKPEQLLKTQQKKLRAIINHAYENVEYYHNVFNSLSLKPKDIQIAEVHDCFTIAEIVAMEDLGFYEKGKAVEAIRNGESKRSGSLPINTSGGLKSKGHPVGASGAAMPVEIFKQMRGIAERNRQVKFNVERALTHNLGGSGGTCVVTIYEK